MTRGEARILLVAVFIFFIVLLLAMVPRAHGRDVYGVYADSPLKPWFDSLHDKRGMSCCSTADGIPLEDPDWEVFSAQICRGTTCEMSTQYRVHVGGKWMDVPDEAVLTQPNRAEKTMVWIVNIVNSGPVVRCFLPGTES